MANNNQGLIGAVMISAAGFLSFYFVLQTYSQIGQLRTAVNERQAILDSRTTIVEKIADLKKTYEKNKDKVELISMPIPDKKHLPELISTVEYIANSSGLQLLNLNIIENKGSENEQIGTLQIESKFNGGYISFKNLLSLVEVNRRLIDVTSFKLNLDKFTGNILMDLSGKTYVLRANAKTTKKSIKSNKDEE